MTPEQKAAYINAQIFSASCEIEGMKAANCQQSEDQPYREQDFNEVPARYGLHHNQVVEFFQN